MLKFKFLQAFIKTGRPQSLDKKGRAKTHTLHAVPLPGDLRLDVGKTNFPSFVIRFLKIAKRKSAFSYPTVEHGGSHGCRKPFGVTGSQDLRGCWKGPREFPQPVNMRFVDLEKKWTGPYYALHSQCQQQEVGFHPSDCISQLASRFPSSRG